MAISEERLHILLPASLKASLRRLARDRGLSVGEYIRRLVEKDIGQLESRGPTRPFPFGEKPVRSGRTRGSVDHDRPEE